MAETSRLSLETAAAILDKVGYTLCNPVSSGVLSQGKKWPGLRLRWADEPVAVARPSYFRSKGPLPATATLTMVPPSAFSRRATDGLELVSNELDEREGRLRAEARRKGRRFVGLRKLAKQTWNDCPTSFAERMNMSPRVATRDKWRRIEALARNKRFELDYAEALKLWRAGNRDVLFPYWHLQNAGRAQRALLGAPSQAPRDAERAVGGAESWRLGERAPGAQWHFVVAASAGEESRTGPGIRENPEAIARNPSRLRAFRSRPKARRS